MPLEIRKMITPGHENAFTVGARKPDASLADLPAAHRALLEDEKAVTAVLATTNANGRSQPDEGASHASRDSRDDHARE